MRTNEATRVRSVKFLLLILSCTFYDATARSQNPTSVPPRPTFEVATVKPYIFYKGSHLGFRGYPNGRIEVGATTVQTLISYAYDLQDFQIQGGPAWAQKDRFDIVAESSQPLPADSPARRANPTEAEREMLRSLLQDRFHLTFHRQTREAAVYLLVLSGKPLQLQEPKNKADDPRGGVASTDPNFSTAIAFGQNLSMSKLAKQLADDLQSPVIDQTGLTGQYDFNVPTFEPSSHDAATAVVEAMAKIGLKLTRGKAPVETFVIDSVDHPDPN